MTKMVDGMKAQGRYTTVAIALHWIIALALIWQLSLGFTLDGLPRASKGPFVSLHKSLGITILLLSVLRLGWRLTHKPPPLQGDLKPWEKVMAQATHVGFYLIMIGAPLGGWAMSSASSRSPPIQVWGAVQLPALPLPKSDDLSGALYLGHVAAGWIAVALIALHIGAVVKHMFLDDNDVLWRMVPGLQKPPTVP